MAYQYSSSALHELAAQTKVVSYECEGKGLLVSDLDARYKSALHSDTSLAMFKTEGEQTKLIGAYQSFVGEIGAYVIFPKNSYEY